MKLAEGSAAPGSGPAALTWPARGVCPGTATRTPRPSLPVHCAPGARSLPPCSPVDQGGDAAAGSRPALHVPGGPTSGRAGGGSLRCTHAASGSAARASPPQVRERPRRGSNSSKRQRQQRPGPGAARNRYKRKRRRGGRGSAVYLRSPARRRTKGGRGDAPPPAPGPPPQHGPRVTAPGTAPRRPRPSPLGDLGRVPGA